jgi:hypothetical protein
MVEQATRPFIPGQDAGSPAVAAAVPEPGWPLQCRYGPTWEGWTRVTRVPDNGSMDEGEAVDQQTPLINVATPRATLALQAVATHAFARSAPLRRLVRNAGQVADFIDWQAHNFGAVNIFLSRERLWDALAARMEGGADRWHALEFGVAWGYVTGWWLQRVGAGTLETWDGFDRFTGLPRAWREFAAGTFDTGGKPPAIDDARLTWHIGDVEETISELDAGAVSAGRRLILFDLDIYESTTIVWRAIEPLLTRGDLIVFDEAVDPDERRVLDESVLTHGRYDYVGCTASALALAVA